MVDFYPLKEEQVVTIVLRTLSRNDVIEYLGLELMRSLGKS